MMEQVFEDAYLGGCLGIATKMLRRMMGVATKATAVTTAASMTEAQIDRGITFTREFLVARCYRKSLSDEALSLPWGRNGNAASGVRERSGTEYCRRVL